MTSLLNLEKRINTLNGTFSHLKFFMSLFGSIEKVCLEKTTLTRHLKELPPSAVVYLQRLHIPIATIPYEIPLHNISRKWFFLFFLSFQWSPISGGFFFIAKTQKGRYDKRDFRFVSKVAKAKRETFKGRA